MKPFPHATGWLPPFQPVTLFRADETRAIRERILKELPPMLPAKRLSETGEGYVDDVHRRCLTTDIFPSDSLYTLVIQRVTAILPALQETYGFDLHSEPERLLPFFQVNRYRGSERGRIGYHMDLDGRVELEERKLSLSILLNDASSFQGGDLLIHDGDAHYPLRDAVAGQGVAFPSFAMHGVEEVTEGDRWTMVLWLHGPRFR